MTVHSNDSMKPRTTKLERLGKLARTHKDIVFSNLGHILNEELLKQAYQELDGKKAIGIDGITKETYGRKLNENIQTLLMRVRKGAYKPQPSRIVEIPKEDGSKRPLAIACFEDKIVQWAVSIILSRIYEPLFLPCSYGFRPAQNCHKALRALMQHTYPCWDGAIVEIDICKYFNTIPHKELKDILQKKISDKRFLGLINKLVEAPTIDKGTAVRNLKGCPQGSILSPILANIYLHEVVDKWFNEIKQSHFRGKAEEVRYADDMVFIFQNYLEAKRFFEVLPKRLQKYGLEIKQEKSQLVRSGQNVAEREHKKGRRLKTYHFLGFTVYWAKARNGKWWRMKFKSRRDRMTQKLKGLKLYLRKQLTTKDTQGTLKHVIRVIKGWLNYHAISDNERQINRFLDLTRSTIRKWINRRGRRKWINWEKFDKLMTKLEFPRKWKTISLFAKPC